MKHLHKVIIHLSMFPIWFSWLWDKFSHLASYIGKFCPPGFPFLILWLFRSSAFYRAILSSTKILVGGVSWCCCINTEDFKNYFSLQLLQHYFTFSNPFHFISSWCSIYNFWIHYPHFHIFPNCPITAHVRVDSFQDI